MSNKEHVLFCLIAYAFVGLTVIVYFLIFKIKIFEKKATEINFKVGENYTMVYESDNPFQQNKTYNMTVLGVNDKYVYYILNDTYTTSDSIEYLKHAYKFYKN